jgi:hypothetical protein
MKVSLLATAALAGLLLSGCAAQGAPAAGGTAAAPSAAAGAPSAATAAQPSASPASATPAALSTEGKVHFTGDYKKTTAADSAKIIELSKQWYSPEKEAALKEKLTGAGLASNIPPEQVAQGWYSRTATACQAKFDGYKMKTTGVWAEIDKVVTGTYCPEVPEIG